MRKLVVLLIATVPSLALAAGPGAVPTTKAATPPGGGGMPQLNFSNPLTLSQVVWLVVIFAVLYVLLKRWALPRVAGVVEERAASIKADLEAAHQAKTEADGAVREITRATREAHAAAQARIGEAVGRAKAEAAEQARVAGERLDAQLAEAEMRIGQARAAAMGALRDVARDTTNAIVTRLIGRAPAASAVEAAVGGAMGDAGRPGASPLDPSKGGAFAIHS